MSGSGANRQFYRISAQKAATNNVEVNKFVATVFTIISNFTNAWSNGDTWELDIRGTRLTWLKNSTTISSTTTSGLSTGSAGITYSSGAGPSGVSFENWEGGSLDDPGLPSQLLASGFTMDV
jgi:hypothetical protein